MNRFIRESDDHTLLGAWLKRNISHMKEYEYAFNYETNIQKLHIFAELRKRYAALREEKWQYHEHIEKISYSAGPGWKLFHATSAVVSWRQQHDVLICIEDDAHATLFALDAWHDITNAAL